MSLSSTCALHYNHYRDPCWLSQPIQTLCTYIQPDILANLTVKYWSPALAAGVQPEARSKRVWRKETEGSGNSYWCVCVSAQNESEILPSLQRRCIKLLWETDFGWRHWTGGGEFINSTVLRCDVNYAGSVQALGLKYSPWSKERL